MSGSPMPLTARFQRTVARVSDRDELVRPRVRVVVDESTRRRRVRELSIAVVVCAALLVAILLVGLASAWSWWAVLLVGLVPLIVGGLAMRAAMVIGRSRRELAR
jgi:1,4-dihydroxy-2-naphthoate octaprenyltransferase